jgi:hypothetical protein
MTRLSTILVVLPILLFGTGAPADAQFAPQSGCADCHFARPDAPAPDHLAAWDRSPHGRGEVGCEKCHGGNPKVFEPLVAHKGMLGPGHRLSGVNRRNLPATCGGCHVGPFVAFQDSRHYQLLRDGIDVGPTCSTCHGTTEGRVLSAKALGSQCNSCHGPNAVAPRDKRAARARELYQTLAGVRDSLRTASSLIKRVKDPERRADLLAAYQQAEVPVTRAVNAGHKFVYAELEEYLAVAQERTDALLARLAEGRAH